MKYIKPKIYYINNKGYSLICQNGPTAGSSPSGGCSTGSDNDPECGNMCCDGASPLPDDDPVVLMLFVLPEPIQAVNRLIVSRVQ